MTKMILAAVMATAFLISMPVRAEDKGDGKGAPTEKAKDSQKDKQDKKADGPKSDKRTEKADKAGAGW
jgi:hypothetical protein